MGEVKNNMTRRGFVGAGLGAIASLSLPLNAQAIALSGLPKTSFLGLNAKLFPEELSSLTMPKLEYGNADLAPTISQMTVDFHYGKHTKAYYDNVNKLILNTSYAGKPLEQIVRESAGRSSDVSIYNNAGQALNHSFYFAGLKPKGGGNPPTALADALVKSFGSVDAFKTAFVAEAGARFGSGWVWLVMDFKGELKLMSTANADSPIINRTGLPSMPLFVVDVWEHAYYLDYQNVRAKHVTELLNSLINWDFVAANYDRGSKA